MIPDVRTEAELPFQHYEPPYGNKRKSKGERKAEYHYYIIYLEYRTI